MNNSKKPPWFLAKDVLVKPTRVRSRRGMDFGWLLVLKKATNCKKMVGYQFDDSKLTLNHWKGGCFTKQPLQSKLKPLQTNMLISTRFAKYDLWPRIAKIFLGGTNQQPNQQLFKWKQRKVGEMVTTEDSKATETLDNFCCWATWTLAIKLVLCKSTISKSRLSPSRLCLSREFSSSQNCGTKIFKSLWLPGNTLQAFSLMSKKMLTSKV